MNTNGLSRLLIVASLSLIACGRPEFEPVTELHTEVYDSQVLPMYIDNLRKAGIAFRQEGNTIFYAKEDRERARKAFDQALEERPQHFGFSDTEQSEKFIAALRDVGIPAEAARSDEGLPYRVYVPKARYEQAREILHEQFHPKPKAAPAK